MWQIKMCCNTNHNANNPKRRIINSYRSKRRTINCTYKVILQVYDPVTQKWCNELAGICEKLRHKKLMQPEEFGDLEDVFCIFPTGCCRIKKIKYWEEELFKKN